ncbi:MAG TPA: maleylpyruvate isomerase family mycothiol-dependent enzyme [Streptosporangiaceae bacterium]|jgi:uncharacterized protein (TIGR03083 family)
MTRRARLAGRSGAAGAGRIAVRQPAAGWCAGLAGMEFSRYLDCLAAEFARLRAAVPADLAAAVPTCPGWTVADLTRHVGRMYLHQSLCIRDRAEPEPWPPPGLAAEEPVTLLDRGYAALAAQFAAHGPADPAGCWFTPGQTVGFWARRMAQETVIHRIDAELSTGRVVGQVPADLATDGIDELLRVFLAWSFAQWPEDFTPILASSPGWTCAVQAGDTTWRVRTGPGTLEVADGPGGTAADLTVSGPPSAVLRWAWNREAAAELSGVTVTGPPGALAELQRCIVAGVQ